MTVYYESLCPDSKAFIVDQLTPTVRGNLGKYVDLTLVPYGKSSVSYNRLSISNPLKKTNCPLPIAVQDPWIGH